MTSRAIGEILDGAQGHQGHVDKELDTLFTVVPPIAEYSRTRIPAETEKNISTAADQENPSDRYRIRLSFDNPLTGGKSGAQSRSVLTTKILGAVKAQMAASGVNEGNINAIRLADVGHDLIGKTSVFIDIPAEQLPAVKKAVDAIDERTINKKASGVAIG